MLYRKAPPQPPRLLLRVVAVAGSGTLLAAAACTMSTSSGSIGNPYNPDSGYEDTTVDQAVDQAADQAVDQAIDQAVDSGGPMGLVDGGGDSSSTPDVLLGVVPNPDSGAD
jgi:hypothetical protein